ncbi:MAG: IS3 family transposase [Burkholderiales bacterium]|nr:IS3 family transposase [Burkholderiales bacterium]
MRYAWIVEHRASYSIPMMCDLLSVSRSGLYGALQRAGAVAAKARDDERIVQEIRRAQRHHRGRYGRRRMTPEIREALGQAVNHKRIGRLMREHGLGSRKRRPFRVVTTDSRHAHPIAPNVVDRDFATTLPNRKWLADLTYVRTDEGWLYLALVLDLFSRKLVGWAMSDSMPQELTIEALRVAIGGRDPGAGLVHHSDRGSQYAAGDYRKILAARGITVSMSRKGDCWDNAPMESVNGTVKVECVHGEHFATREQARRTILEFIGYYNAERRHSSLGYLTPVQFERHWQQAQAVRPLLDALTRVAHRRPVPVRRKRPNRPSVDNAHRSAS